MMMMKNDKKTTDNQLENLTISVYSRFLLNITNMLKLVHSVVLCWSRSAPAIVKPNFILGRPKHSTKS